MIKLTKISRLDAIRFLDGIIMSKDKDETNLLHFANIEFPQWNNSTFPANLSRICRSELLE